MGKSKVKNVFVAVVLAMLTLLPSCTDSPETQQKKWKECTVAVVLPKSGGLDAHWKRTLELASSNVEDAFINQDIGVKLKYEWYDEESPSLQVVCEQLAQRDDIVAVIGGLYSSNASMMAPIFSRAAKSFFTLATTEELVRAHSTGGYLWAMVETDITQCEILLTKASQEGAKSIALIVDGDNLYGKTFLDWCGFVADELHLKVKGIYDYSHGEAYGESYLAASSGADCLICVADNAFQIKEMQTAFADYKLRGGNLPHILYSDTAYGADVLEVLKEDAEGIEGIAFGADPSSGFDATYSSLFGCSPTVGEAQVYDAAVLIAYAEWYRILHPELLFKEGMREVVSGRAKSNGSWMSQDICSNLDAIAQGIMPDISGASGSLDFDSKVFTNVLATVYYGFKVNNGKYQILDYYISDGSNRLDSGVAGWNLKNENMQDLGNEDFVTYAPLKYKKAVLVAASAGWGNYRHQADVLAMYQLLKHSGFSDDNIILISDDNIILIMEDDIAGNEKNPEDNIVRVEKDGENVYSNVIVDYHISELTPSDVLNFLSADENTNVFLFWSGHGLPGGMCWNEEDYGLTADIINGFLRDLAERGKFRQLLCCIESCFAGSIFQEITDIPGALFITAANAFETSKADNYDDVLGIWRSNRFTVTLRQQLTDNPDCSVYDLYQRLFINTIGSHVMVYNQHSFGSLKTTLCNEFTNQNN